MPGNQRHPSLSPEGGLLLYQGSETGRDEIHLRTFPGGSGHWQVSTRGGTVPRWSAKGDRIYFVEDETLMEVDVVLRPAVQIGSPRKIFALDSQSALNPRDFDVSPDGRLFAFGQEVIPAQGSTKFLTLVENWSTEFAERIPK